MVRLSDGCVAVFDVQMAICRVNIFGGICAPVMLDHAIAGHGADGAFDKLSPPVAASAAGFVTFAKSNAKALLTAEPSKVLCSPRGYATPAGASP